MRQDELAGLLVAEIMNRWPVTLGVFIDLGMHCVGCPIGMFHTLADAAEEHDLPLDVVAAEIAAAIAGNRPRGGPERPHRRSAAIGADPSPAASGGRPRPALPPPRR